jgi:hypothetical protein
MVNTINLLLVKNGYQEGNKHPEKSKVDVRHRGWMEIVAVPAVV